MDYSTRKEIAKEEIGLNVFDLLIEYLGEVGRVSIKYELDPEQEREIGLEYLADIQVNNSGFRTVESKPVKLRLIKKE